MKKFIAIAAALVSFGAFAQENRHMVTLSGYENDRDATLGRSLDIYHTNGGSDHDTTRSLALNYAYALNGSWQVGVDYAMWDKEGEAKETEESTRYGIFAIYNFAGKLTDTNYLALKYSMLESEGKSTAGAKDEDSESNVWGLEFGHRFSLGNLWGMNFNWSPSLAVAIADNEDNFAKEDSSTTQVTLNVLKVDVLF